METFINNALRALPSVASSPLALVGYVVVIAAWLIIALRVKRNKQLLKHLKDLPAKDRLQALREEMGTVPVKEGLSPEQYLRSRIHLYYLIGFAVLCILVLMIFVISSTNQGTAEVDVTGFQEDTDTQESTVKHEQGRPGFAAPSTAQSYEAPVLNEYDKTSGRHVYGGAPDETLKYTYDRIGNIIHIKPELNYLTRLINGEPSESIEWFYWQFPKLSIKVVNNTKRTLILTEAIVNIKSSKINKEPLLMIDPPHYFDQEHFSIRNEGWGRVNDPIINLSIQGAVFDTSVSIRAPAFSKKANIDLRPYLKNISSRTSDLSVSGEIKYVTEDNQNRVTTFRFIVPFKYEKPGLPLVLLPTYFYDLFLESGKSGYVMRFPISQVIKAGEADHFVIRIATDKSSQFDLDFSFLAAGGIMLHGNEVLLDVIIPRSEEYRIAPVQNVEDK